MPGKCYTTECRCDEIWVLLTVQLCACRLRVPLSTASAPAGTGTASQLKRVQIFFNEAKTTWKLMRQTAGRNSIRITVWCLEATILSYFYYCTDWSESCLHNSFCNKWRTETQQRQKPVLGKKKKHDFLKNCSPESWSGCCWTEGGNPRK